MLVLDGGSVDRLAVRNQQAEERLLVLRRRDLWPPTVPSIVLVECLTGDQRRDAAANRFLKACNVVDEVSVPLARRAARLRSRAGRGSAVDALVVAVAEPDGVVITGDTKDLSALAAHADGVTIERA